MAKNDKAALPGHEALTMADQLRAARISDQERTNPMSGAVDNPRRTYLRNVIAAKPAAKPVAKPK